MAKKPTILVGKTLLNTFGVFCKNATKEKRLGIEKAEVLALEVQGCLKLMYEFYCGAALTTEEMDEAADLAEQSIEKLKELEEPEPTDQAAALEMVNAFFDEEGLRR